MQVMAGVDDKNRFLTYIGLCDRALSVLREGAPVMIVLDEDESTAGGKVKVMICPDTVRLDQFTSPDITVVVSEKTFESMARGDVSNEMSAPPYGTFLICSQETIGNLAKAWGITIKDVEECEPEESDEAFRWN